VYNTAWVRPPTKFIEDRADAALPFSFQLLSAAQIIHSHDNLCPSASSQAWNIAVRPNDAYAY